MRFSMKEINFTRIGAKIREIRLSKGLTQEYVANVADVNTSHISNIENNRVKVSLSTLVQICNAMNTTVDYILSNASVGSGSLSIYFRQGTDADMAAVNVQNKVSRATGLLPSEVTQIGVMTMKRQTSMVKIFALYSPTIRTTRLSFRITPKSTSNRVSSVFRVSVRSLRSAPPIRCAFG